MTDYGHELLFGAFVTPAARPPQQAVELAVAADEFGLDVVTFQDHPYQPTFHDAWTLMSYVASRTSRIKVAGNVLNLPLREPAVLARAVASLDLLSGGRVELGLGAGAFWDAIEAMGGRRLTPGQAVDALAEGIEIIRSVWDTSSKGGVHVHGKYYTVDGAKRGPAPAHDVSIWVGALKPRMLALTGRLADGWLPSLAYLKGGPSELTGMNERIDAAAVEAGRSPSDVRRLLNVGGSFAAQSRGFLDGPPDQWAEELAGLTLEYGTSGFILATDNPAAIELFAKEIAPATRELVAAER
ncbi:alkanesulfonate monooxygenase SsuD/methylene tetrahydromethanopterin reductase-like flavin-dependent oxidoreductase (luciferase family) [Catenuloplanes nepalensis]|uniref:Alkanesulfonate monooxygenase SsuD/methylene tetrahydromethanopterin reductase-like flavin-dependent oxidoreductase (Luciferase family) n=1 Tax=Catenuloplanes nepalensis TaxID=587533 RepID=A0ABT9MWW3_9ACTN|nr:LLM class flavin-dependent oxidoreductase [Catenuloplanes nepalensis]MDP9795501.1 alkanesulfonate monooxygenase SsuD/methylene tetrahydromethanopterin reductase-like flavin-dependent oxidoreductase (luciferase family) [Catenuloplanes nepalensis]